MNGDCVIGATHAADIKSLQRAEEVNAQDHGKMWDAIDHLRNRLPVWATVVISVLTFICGILVTLAGLAKK